MRPNAKDEIIGLGHKKKAQQQPPTKTVQTKTDEKEKELNSIIGKKNFKISRIPTRR